MSDYISREAALNFEMEIDADPEEIQAITNGMAIMSEYIKGLPAADVVERANANEAEFWKDQYICASEDQEQIMTEEYAKQKQRWIPVTERLPEEKDRYLTVSIEPWFGTTVVDTMRWSGIWMYDGRQTEATVTHWMPLPDPPKDGEA